MPVDESLGLIDDYLTRPAAQLGLMMMGHCTPREAEEFFAKMGGMTPSVSTLQRLTQSMHERWESIAPETLASIRAAEDIPADAVSASVSLDGVMVALRAGEGGCAEACWREASCGTVSFHDAKGKRLKTLYLGRMPESGKVRLKAQLASEVAHIRRVRPEIRIGAVADGAADNWTFLESLSPETEVIDFWHACEHLRVASDHAVAPHWFEKHREILRHDPRGVAKVIRALCYLRDSAKGDRAEIERELAYFRKHRHRMRYHALKEEGVAIGSGVVETRDSRCAPLYVIERMGVPVAGNPFRALGVAAFDDRFRDRRPPFCADPSSDPASNRDGCAGSRSRKRSSALITQGAPLHTCQAGSFPLAIRPMTVRSRTPRILAASRTPSSPRSFSSPSR